MAFAKNTNDGFMRKAKVAVPAALGAIALFWAADQHWFFLGCIFGLMSFMVGQAYFELMQAASGANKLSLRTKDQALALIVGAVVFVLLLLPESWWLIPYGPLFAVMSVLFTFENVNSRGSRAVMVFGVVYVACTPFVIEHVFSGPTGFWVVLIIALIPITTDTAAQVVGRKVGGLKLAPRISHKKTVSGAIGGVAAVVLLMLGLLTLLPAVTHVVPDSSLGVLLYAGVLSTVAQLGDLLASIPKRIFGIKDYSDILGKATGGVCDRFDSHFAVWNFHGLMLWTDGWPLTQLMG